MLTSPQHLDLSISNATQSAALPNCFITHAPRSFQKTNSEISSNRGSSMLSCLDDDAPRLTGSPGMAIMKAPRWIIWL